MSETTSSIKVRCLQVAALAAAMLAVGCESTQPSEKLNAPLHQVLNVYRAVIKLPPDIRRVAVLPIAADEQSPDAVAGREVFQPVLMEEALQTHEFEPVAVSTAQMTRWFGKQTVSSDEVLPSNLLERIEKETGSNAVLLARLTAYRPYPPVSEGWNLKLVWSKNAEILWAVEDIFDTSDSRVAASARREFKTQEATSAALADPSAGLQSPRRIAQYALRSLFGTMPKH